MAVLMVNATRDGVTQDFGPYEIDPPVNRFVQYVRSFFIFRRWTINSVTQI
jgi:hypothetical protein